MKHQISLSRTTNILCNALISAALLSGAISLCANAQSSMANLTTVMLGNRPLFQITNGTKDLSAVARAALIQWNINEALLDLADERPKVSIKWSKGTPQIEMNGHYIGSVDAATAGALGLSQDALAQLWSVQLQTALNDQISVGRHIASLGSCLTSVEESAIVEDHVQSTNSSTSENVDSIRFANLPIGLAIPMAISDASKLSMESLKPGATITAEITKDIKLPSGETLPAGTLVTGQVSSMETDGANQTLLHPTFDAIKLREGTEFPISARVEPAFVRINAPETPLKLRLNTRAQIAVSGTIL